ncbi:phosphatidate cytidylyltransferase [Silanimonas sp.]|jgi:phosphatidate cytidylyltransferase|uniref:phosphatidate cytidylyltransferase n=1 Tax=Silanimonas sp. TaxID=1929290 RepID=UPI0022CB44C1|nr:phosphatidate cytidylyltransferase [Silanimonas sp.]MCZ8063493.1 phosphatidate cytidylyltransferase [Silanimonas sp.]
MSRTRILTGLVLAPTAVAGLLWLPTEWLALVAAVLLLAGLWEWTRLTGLSDPMPRLGYITANALMIAALAWAAGPNLFALKAAALLGVAWWVLALAWLWRFEFGQADRGRFRILKLLAGSLAAVPAWAALVWLHQLPGHGPRWALFAVMLVWAADTGAYFVGVRMGKHKMAPRISPNKSWEGFWGGLAGASLIAVLAVKPLGLGWDDLPVLVFLTIVAAMMSVAGDLFESLLKRHSGHKDSGRLIPGHGGMLDRLDSLLAALPVFMVGKLWLGL